MPAPLRALALAALAAAPAAAEIRSAADCAAAIAEDAAAAREAAAVWTRLGGGAEAEICEAAALEAMGAMGAAALILTELAENRRRALPAALRLAVYEDAARLWLADGRPELAVQVLDNLDRLAPATPDRLRLRARVAAEAGDWPQATAALDALIAAAPDDARARALRAASLRLGGAPYAARAEAEAALALDPDLPEGLFEAAAAAAETGDRAAAATLWRRLIAAHPDHELATLARRNLASN
jgi:tetratricopeptide (TPR) repeat protein